MEHNENFKIDKNLTDKLGLEFISKTMELVGLIDLFTNSSLKYLSIINDIMIILQNIFIDMKENIISDNRVNYNFKLLTNISRKFMNNNMDVKIKLLQISEVEFGTEIGEELRKTHNEMYKLIHKKTLNMIEESQQNIIKPLYELRNYYEQILDMHKFSKFFNKWYKEYIDKISNEYIKLRESTENNTIVKTHIYEFKNKLRKDISIYDYTNDIKKIKPVNNIERLKSIIKIPVKYINSGDYSAISLYDINSDWYKESYQIFTEDDLNYLKGTNVEYIYSQENINNNVDLSKLKVVIIDKDKSFNEVISKELSRLKLNVISFTNMDFALYEISYEIPDIIFLDIRILEEQNDDLLLTIKSITNKKIYNNVPVIMTCSWLNEYSIDDYLNIGADDYIVKPFSVEDILNKIVFHYDLKNTYSRHF